MAAVAQSGGTVEQGVDVVMVQRRRLSGEVDAHERVTGWFKGSRAGIAACGRGRGSPAISPVVSGVGGADRANARVRDPGVGREGSGMEGRREAGRWVSQGRVVHRAGVGAGVHGGADETELRGEEGEGGEGTDRQALLVRGTARTRAGREALGCGSGLLGRSGKKAGPGRRVLGQLGRKGKRGGGPALLGQSESLCWAVRTGRERERERETGPAGLNGSCRSWWAELGWVF